jgi:nitroreductase
MSQAPLQDEIRDEVKPFRQPEHDIDAIFVNRWSPRAFSSEAIDDEILMRVFEAAKWAPSCFNEQPWRFIVARTPEDRAVFLDFLTPGNQVWNENVPVITLVIAHKYFAHNGKPNATNQFDAGCAWGFLALSALQNGLITHGMAGFNAAKARVVLGVPEEYDIIAVVAIGKPGDKSQLPADVQAKEVPSTRRRLGETVMEGKFRP